KKNPTGASTDTGRLLSPQTIRFTLRPVSTYRPQAPNIATTMITPSQLVVAPSRRICCVLMLPPPAAAFFQLTSPHSASVAFHRLSARYLLGSWHHQAATSPHPFSTVSAPHVPDQTSPARPS